ncbi:predicted protein [Chaetomium globosum CBS 148.51]|uniref:Uncharacterized protein n=1 Tax=Chaetomium globosum (strain ATCC 6205 / CBS 148.51 / DSM 1962 / NBRC 6347 / NRRL 1970) TaxID=306901 RepID=Q2HAJ1_CHAGB|nr:uncharacterized protein CHGG_02763 [Chaetomium globosum CBS 148.51]EAQ90828.1 predicted protein [Chaetomium globosum CBS 148.51]
MDSTEEFQPRSSTQQQGADARVLTTRVWIEQQDNAIQAGGRILN